MQTCCDYRCCASSSLSGGDFDLPTKRLSHTWQFGKNGSLVGDGLWNNGERMIGSKAPKRARNRLNDFNDKEKYHVCRRLWNPDGGCSTNVAEYSPCTRWPPPVVRVPYGLKLPIEFKLRQPFTACESWELRTNGEYEQPEDPDDMFEAQVCDYAQEKCKGILNTHESIYFTVQPSGIRFSNPTEGKKYTRRLRVRNKGTVSRRIAVIGPPNALLSASFGASIGESNLVVPGRSASILVTYTAKNQEPITEVVTIIVDGDGGLVVPICADACNVPLLEMEEWDVGCCLVGSLKASQFQVINRGETGRFWILSEDEFNDQILHLKTDKVVASKYTAEIDLMAEDDVDIRKVDLHSPEVTEKILRSKAGTFSSPPFEISPGCFRLQKNQSIKLNITFNPKRHAQVIRKLAVLCDNKEVRWVTIKGVGVASPSIIDIEGNWSAPPLDLPCDVSPRFAMDCGDLVPTEIEKRPFKIKNKSCIPLLYFWVLRPHRFGPGATHFYDDKDNSGLPLLQQGLVPQNVNDLSSTAKPEALVNVIPSCGILPPHGEVEITISVVAPEHHGFYGGVSSLFAQQIDAKIQSLLDYFGPKLFASNVPLSMAALKDHLPLKKPPKWYEALKSQESETRSYDTSKAEFGKVPQNGKTVIEQGIGASARSGGSQPRALKNYCCPSCPVILPDEVQRIILCMKNDTTDDPDEYDQKKLCKYLSLMGLGPDHKQEEGESEDEDTNLVQEQIRQHIEFVGNRCIVRREGPVEGDESLSRKTRIPLERELKMFSASLNVTTPFFLPVLQDGKTKLVNLMGPVKLRESPEDTVVSPVRFGVNYNTFLATPRKSLRTEEELTRIRVNSRGDSELPPRLEAPDDRHQKCYEDIFNAIDSDSEWKQELMDSLIVDCQRFGDKVQKASRWLDLRSGLQPVHEMEVWVRSIPLPCKFQPECITAIGSFGDNIRRVVQFVNSSRHPVKVFIGNAITKFGTIVALLNERVVFPGETAEFGFVFTFRGEGTVRGRLCGKLMLPFSEVMCSIEYHICSKGPIVRTLTPVINYGQVQARTKQVQTLVISNTGKLRTAWKATCQLQGASDCPNYLLRVWPEAGWLEGNESSGMQVYLCASMEGPFSGVITIHVEENLEATVQVSVLANVVSPTVYLMKSRLTLVDAFINVPNDSVAATLCNPGDIPVPFKWGSPVGISAQACTVTVTPSEGLVPIKGCVNCKFEFFSSQSMELTNLYVPCCVAGAKETLLVKLEGKVHLMRLRVCIPKTVLRASLLSNLPESCKRILEQQLCQVVAEIPGESLDYVEEVVFFENCYRALTRAAVPPNTVSDYDGASRVGESEEEGVTNLEGGEATGTSGKGRISNVSPKPNNETTDEVQPGDLQATEKLQDEEESAEFESSKEDENLQAEDGGEDRPFPPLQVYKPFNILVSRGKQIYLQVRAADEIDQATFSISNESPHAVTFEAKILCHSPLPRWFEATGTEMLALTDDFFATVTKSMGHEDYFNEASGVFFKVTPAKGKLEPNESLEFLVQFKANYCGFYQDRVVINFEGLEQSYEVLLDGLAILDHDAVDTDSASLMVPEDHFSGVLSE